MEKCPITDLPMERIDGNSYRINYNNELLFIKLGYSFDILSKEEEFINNKFLLAGAILNKQLSDNEDVYWFSITKNELKEKLAKIIYPKTPKEKFDNLFNSLYSMQKYDGETVSIVRIVSAPDFYYKHFFKSNDECFYYIKTLHQAGLINCEFQRDTELPIEFNTTFKGLNYYLELSEKGNLSNKCFVAMSFNSDMRETREAIKAALFKNDYVPIVIDEQLIDSSQTINDAIISAIRSCKFCISDFTQQKDGVYFESGFAIGLGKSVIYTCRKDWFEKSHFDTNHFPHLIYSTNEELTDMLDKKIKAWIK